MAAFLGQSHAQLFLSSAKATIVAPHKELICCTLVHRILEHDFWSATVKVD